MGAAPLALPRQAGASKIVMGIPTQPFRAGSRLAGGPPGLEESGPRGNRSHHPIKPRSLLASNGPTKVVP
jgi:hypothetical protein